MLTNGDWNRIRTYTDQVANREADHIVFQGGRVIRDPTGILISLDGLQVDLEPADE